MSFTASDLAALDTAISSGELTVEVNGRRVTYRSIDELIRARNIAKSELRTSSGASSSGVRRGSYSVKFKTSRE